MPRANRYHLPGHFSEVTQLAHQVPRVPKEHSVKVHTPDSSDEPF